MTGVEYSPLGYVAGPMPLALPGYLLRALLGVVIACEQAGLPTCTVREAQTVAGYASTNTMHGHLKALRDRHLVTWDQHDDGRVMARTLRPLVERVA